MNARADMAAKAAALKTEGLNVLQVAARLGISRSYSYELLTDPEGRKIRGRKDSYRGTCKTCGAATDGSNGRSAPDRCSECHANRHAERNARIFAAWEAGETARAIAAREGMNVSAVCALVDFHRQQGEAISRRMRARKELWPEIQRMWRDGATSVEIASALDTTAPNVTQMIRVMRRHGIDVSYRLPRRVAA